MHMALYPENSIESLYVYKKKETEDDSPVSRPQRIYKKEQKKNPKKTKNKKRKQKKTKKNR